MKTKELGAFEDFCAKNNIILQAANYGNPGQVRNLGIEQINSEWVCFSDSDDLLKLDQMIKAIEEANEGIDFIVGNYTIRHSSTFVQEHLLPKNIKPMEKWFLLGLNPGLWRFIFKAEKISRNRFPNTKWGEDQAFLSNITFSEDNTYFASRILYEYHLNVLGQLTSQKQNANDLRSTIQISKESINSSQIPIFNFTMFVRQCLTFLRNSPIRQKFYGISTLIATCCSHPKYSLFLLYKFPRARKSFNK